jgi:hypothetical protein
MADVVNLRRARKRKAREIAAAEAENRRAAFGILQVTRKAARDEREFAERRLEAHRLDEPTPGRTDDGE